MKKGKLHMLSNHLFQRPWWVALPLVLLCACNHMATARESSGRNSLAIVGYNYTNRAINSFSINGQGGGDIGVSSPTSGGGGTVCCALYTPGSTVRMVNIRWQSGGCYFSKQSSLSKQMLNKLHWFYKEQEAPVEILASTDASYMEVHFYPDGSLKVAVTAHMSSPRLSLDEQRRDKTPYPRCPDDREPAQ